ncbi:MAG: M3 family oligoendopeptidase [Firmicutes bacterium]|nr:M3 family oligoendopeptidase [Bacillota bacterium]
MTWTFSQLPYARPDTGAFKASYRGAIERLRKAAAYPEARAAYKAQEDIHRKLNTLQTIVSIRNTMDTKDAFYDAENTFFNEEMAKFMPLIKEANEALLASPFRPEFEREFGRQLFTLLAIGVKTQDEAIVPDLIEESELCETFKKITAGCQAVFMGETRNFYGLLKYMENPDRNVRRAAYIQWATLYEAVSEPLDSLYDQLIAVRLRMAKKLGLPSYTELAYLNMRRADYTAAEVASFRAQVAKIITPAADRYRRAQAARIGVDTLRYYDESYMFPNGNADPLGGEKGLIQAARAMYRDLSPETGEFFDFMLEHGLFDLPTRPGKHLGGYCTYLLERQAPFIFSNFNGTAADVGVLTHEAGHAFAFYMSMREQPLLDYISATSEVDEIHSMTMEHFAYPWLDKFYGPANVRKARFAHLMEAFCTIPYLVSVDEFQHRVFENPAMSAKERRTLWREIEKTYMPWRDYDGVPFLEEGGFWMQKQHIFLYPFYYIDYALAQVGAFELYGRTKADRQAAWADYLRLCKAGGSRGYFDLLRLANLSNPFAPGSVEKAVSHVIRELDGL